jgi:ATP-dependent Clp protease ATP-binding subunit ClpC
MYQPAEATELEQEIETVRKAKEDSINAQEYEKAANLRDKEKTLREELEAMMQQWEKKKEEHQVIVDEDDIAAVVGKLTGIPTTRLTEEETMKVLKMQETLRGSIIGQDPALDKVCKAIRRSRADIKDPNRPIGAFLFLGPTGVGKTLLARNLAIQMFGGEDSLIQVDMSEYMEKFAVSKMTGSPPGYVGYEEGGQLTEQVRRRPYSVVLFDEVEKAHPDVMNILLQILEEGRLSDSFGRKVDFRNTIIIMTSNLGSDLIQRTTEVGFGVKEGMPDFAQMEQKIDRAIKKHFKPEFINRLDATVIFKALDRDDLCQVIDLEVIKLQERLKKKEIFIELDTAAKHFIAERGYQPEMGARPIRRTVQQYLEDPLSEKILQEPGVPHDFEITHEAGKEELTFSERKKKKEKKKLATANASQGGGESED